MPLRSMPLLPALPVLLAVAAAASSDTEGGGLVLAGGGKGYGKRPKGALAVTKDIERRVVEAGGNIQGALVASLSWTSADDLDLHMSLPGGGEISYARKKASGGELDVDMCVQGRHSGKCNERPVENIVFMDEPAAGRYKVYVQNFNYHLNTLPQNMQVALMQEGRSASKEEKQLRLTQDRPVLFDLLVKTHGTKKLFEGLCTPTSKTLKESDTVVLEFDYDPSVEDEEARFVTVFEASNKSECERYAAKLIAAGAEDRTGVAKRGRQGSSAGPRPASAATRATRPPPEKKGKRKGSSARQNAARDSALQAVRAANYEVLLSKPASALRAWLTDLGAVCRGCMDKAEFVERLLEVAGVSRQHGEEL